MTRPSTSELIRWVAELDAVIASDLASDDEKSRAAHDRDGHIWGLGLRAEEGDREAAAYLACESNAVRYFDEDYFEELTGDERRDGGR